MAVLTAFRHAAYDTPWWAIPNPGAGRFHEAGAQSGDHTVQYLCLHPLGPAAEMLRHHLGPDGDPDDVTLNLWTATVTAQPVRIDFAECTQWGITPEELVGDDDYAPTRALAARVCESGAEAMIVPSAALPGTHNLVLFGPRVAHPYLAGPIIAEEVPTGHLSDAARTPAEVAPHVRWFGREHHALRQWRATGDYPLFDDPVPPLR